jgi:NitT/TauT family transport system substrate-binding protein
MISPRRRLIAIAVAIGAILAVVPNAVGVDAQTPITVRVAAIAIDVGALSYFADQQGFYKKHGLDVQIVTGVGGGPAIAAAVIGGSLDIGDGNTTTLSTAHERGVPFVLLSPSGAYSSKAPTAALVVLKTSPLKSAKDLAGKTIAVSNIRTVSEVALRAWLDKTGVSSDSVKLVEVPFSQMGVALTSGRIDAAVAEEPALSDILAADGRVLATVYDAIAPQWIEGGYFCTVDFAKSHPDVVAKFADAMAEAAVWANANRAATAVMLQDFAKRPLSSTTQRMFYPDRLRIADLQPLIDASAKYGVLKAPFPAKDMFAPGIVVQ